MEIEIGRFWGKGKYRKKIRDVIKLQNGWYLIKTDNTKSINDFKVKVIFSLKPSRSMTPKHAHFAIDFYGKICYDKNKALEVLKAIYRVWKGENVNNVLTSYSAEVLDLPGYSLEYILKALNWIFEQEDLNFTSRPLKKQEELNDICRYQNIYLIPERKGSHLAFGVLCDIANGTHPVEALLKANLDIRPRGK